MKFAVMYSLLGLPIMLADASEIKVVDIHKQGSSNNFFSGTANVTDSKSREELKKRLNDVVSDAVKLGYL